MSTHSLSASTLFSVEGWVALVTGGGTGIGLMVARTLAANGAKVYIASRRKEVLEASARVHGSAEALGPNGGSIVPADVDVTSKESIKKLVARIEEENGYLNLLINNAGIQPQRATGNPSDGAEALGNSMFAESMHDSFQKAFLSNCTQVYYVTAAFMPLLAKAASGPLGIPGNVINMSSLAGHLKWAQGGQYSYSASKAAVTHLTRMMASELSNENINIRVNGIAPGLFPSEMTTGTSDSENKSQWDPEVFQKFVVEGVGAKVSRPGTDKELANALLSLATNGYIWGTVVPVDGARNFSESVGYGFEYDIDCLRNADAEVLVKANQALFKYVKQTGLFPVGPSVDGKRATSLPVLLLSEGKYWNGIDAAMISHCENEAKAFTPKHVDSQEDFDAFLLSFLPEGRMEPERSDTRERYNCKTGYEDFNECLGAVIRDSTFTCNT